MSIARDRLRWNGWGRLGESFAPSRSRERWLLDALGTRLGRVLERTAPPVEMEAVAVPPPKLSSAALASLQTACGSEGVRTSRFERVGHAAGKSLPDLLRLRAGELSSLPDAVVYPPDEGAVASVLRVAADANLAVVPFGGGTSVVGGVEARAEPGQAGVLALDTTRLDRLLRIDPTSQTACFQAGIDGPALERALGNLGFTLGHYPQSFEHSTLGGWIAARSSGQQSDGYGSLEDLLVAVRVVTPGGVLRTAEVPRSAAGPDLNAVVLGSEGTLGVIVEACVRIRSLPAASDARGMLFRRFPDGVAAIRESVAARAGASMLRLSDAHETALFRLLRRDPGRRVDPSELALGLAGRVGYGRRSCLLVYAADGDSRAAVRRRMRAVRARGRSHSGLPLGRAPGRGWRRDRFRTPYLRDWLLDHGVAVDTVETAVPWSRVETAHGAILRALRGALESHAGAGLAMGHLSHSHPDGACLYFTFLYPLESENGVGQWRAIKREATDAILAAGGSLSHHHGVGTDHAPWLDAEKGAVGLEALRALKRGLDPQGILNPGKLL